MSQSAKKAYNHGVKPSAKLILAAIPLIVLGYLVFGRMQDISATKAKQAKEGAARRGGAAVVEISTAQSVDIVQGVEAVGTVTPEFTIQLAPRVTGRITYLEIREGERVKPGQLLAKIDPQQADAGVLSARASVNESRSRLAQAEAAMQANAIQIEQAITQAQAEATYAKAALVQVQKSSEAKVTAARAQVRQSASAVASAEADLNSRKAQVASGQANLKNAQLKEQRMKTLYDKGFVSKQDLENAETMTAAAQAALEAQLSAVESAQADLATAKARNDADEANLKSVQATTQADIEAAKARVAQSAAALKTAQGNRNQLQANRANLDALRAGVDSADAQLKGASSQLSDTELRSTIVGTVTKRMADPGSLASPGQPVLTLESTDSVLVDANVTVDDSAKIVKGDVVSLDFDGMPDQSLRGRVDQIVPSANPLDRQVLVRIRLTSQNPGVKPGMFAKVKIETKRVAAQVVVPFDAVKDGTVTVVGQDGKAEIRKVVTGERDKDNIEILSGLAVGEKVVVLSFSPVKDGATVTPTAERRLDGSRVVIDPPKKPADGKGGPPAGIKPQGGR